MASGGTTVTISGTGLAEATAVDFGTSAASSFTVNSPTSITAVSPADSTGTVDITVTTPSGTAPVSRRDQFKYSRPTVTELAPDTGSVAGGTDVSVSGSGFALGTSGTVFEFGKVMATSVNSHDDIDVHCGRASRDEARNGHGDREVSESSSKRTAPADEFSYE